jgi:hypothetical protein
MSISEEASRCGRTCSFCMPGHRATKYTVRAGLYDEENPGTQSNRVLYTHEKDTTCGTNVFIAFTDGGQLRIPMCCNLPYLETKDANGAKLGRTQYICDACLFVPKFHISNRNGETKYLLRPDTCVAGELSPPPAAAGATGHLPTLPNSCFFNKLCLCKSSASRCSQSIVLCRLFFDPFPQDAASSANAIAMPTRASAAEFHSTSG